eukprot:444458_1
MKHATNGKYKPNLYNLFGSNTYQTKLVLLLLLLIAIMVLFYSNQNHSAQMMNINDEQSNPQSKNIALIVSAKCNEQSLFYFNRTIYSHLVLSTMNPSLCLFSISGMDKCKFDTSDFNALVNTIKLEQSKSIADTNINIYFHKHDKTTIENKNYAVSQLKSDNNAEYITFFDFTDIVHPQRMEILNYLINKNKQNILIEAIVHGRIQMDCQFDDISMEYLSEKFNIETNLFSAMKHKQLKQTNFEFIDIKNVNGLMKKYYSFEWNTLYNALSIEIFNAGYSKYRIANAWYTTKKAVFDEIASDDMNRYDNVDTDVVYTASTIIHGHKLNGIDIALGLHCK